MSEYLEDTLTEARKQLVHDHLSICAPCRSELEELNSALNMLHSLPRQDPVFDLWEAFGPAFTRVQAEEKNRAASRSARSGTALCGLFCGYLGRERPAAFDLLGHALGSADRVRPSFSHVFDTLAEGWMIFRTVVCHNTDRKFRRHLSPNAG
jgi:hypothetical protein